jgi:hypothetical protein
VREGRESTARRRPTRPSKFFRSGFFPDNQTSRRRPIRVDDDAVRAILAKMAATPRAVIERYNRITGVG